MVAPATIETSPPTASHAPAVLGLIPLNSSRIVGIQLLVPWLRKNRAKATNRINRISDEPRRYRKDRLADPAAAGSTLVVVGRSTRFQTTIQTAVATAPIVASKTSTCRHESNHSSSTGFVTASVIVPPIAGATEYQPTPRRRSFSSGNQVAISFGADADTKGPNTPKKAIASHREPSPCAAARSTSEPLTERPPSASDQPSPIRSMNRPASGAVTM